MNDTAEIYDHEDHEHPMDDNEAILRFVLSGHAIFTLVSKRTRARYTFKVSKADKGDLYFIGLLSGPDNGADYRYLGILRHFDYPFQRYEVMTSKKSPPVGAPFKGFEWFYKRLQMSAVWQDQMEFYHAGRCGRCGRMLTVPESIEMGIGPECLSKMGG